MNERPGEKTQICLFAIPVIGVFDPLLLHTADLEKLAVNGIALKREPKMLPRPSASISWNVSTLYLFIRPSAFEAAILWRTIISGKTPIPEPNPLTMLPTLIVSFALIFAAFNGN